MIITIVIKIIIFVIIIILIAIIHDLENNKRPMMKMNE